MDSGDSFEVLFALEQLAQQTLRVLTDHYLIGLSQPFQPCRQVGRFSHCQILLALVATHFTHHHEPV